MRALFDAVALEACYQARLAVIPRSTREHFVQLLETIGYDLPVRIDLVVLRYTEVLALQRRGML